MMLNSNERFIFVAISIRRNEKKISCFVTNPNRLVAGEKLLCQPAPIIPHAYVSASHKNTKRGFVKEVTANFNAQSIEREVQEYWRTNETYKTVKQHRSAGKPFFFVDGPPYTTGTIHLGTAWNKILKDSLLRYQRMNGRNVIDRAGYDMHGSAD